MSVKVKDDTVKLSRAMDAAVISSGALINLNMASTQGAKGSAPTLLYHESPEYGKVNGVIAAWGTNNLYPQDRIALIERDTELPTLIDWKARTLQGAGMLPYEVIGYDDFGNEQLRPAPDKVPEALAFLRKRATKRWLREASVDHMFFLNTFAEMILSRNREQIVHIGHQEATDSRVEVMDSTGRIPRVWLNGDWKNYRDINTRIRPAIDCRGAIDDVDELRSRNDGYNYIYLSAYPTPGKKYYQMPHHDGFFSSGWYDVGQAIPEFKKFLMKNQMTIKYHIEIDTQWWEKRYPGFWDTMKDEKRKEIQQNELRKFNELLTGAEKAGRTITSDMEWDIDAKQYKNAWKITPLKGDDMDGKYNEDSREASMHKLRALGIDLTIFGAGPGRDNATSGSGSDKWAAMKMYLASILPMREVLLDPINFIFDYNGWTERGVVPRIVDHPFYMTATASELPSQNPNPKRKD